MRCWQLGQSLCVRAPAKLNLFLEIHGKRPDGFHELETLMVRVGIYDTLRFKQEESEASSLRIVSVGERNNPANSADHTVPTDESNLILRAVRAIQEYAGVNRQTRVTVKKEIPVASGMAGGSSDAAATLIGLNRFWQLGLSRDQLCEIGATLGSDVNFFLAGSNAAVCKGRGEIIEPLAVPADLSFVIVRPRSGLSTAEVFKHCRPSDAVRSIGPLVDAMQNGQSGAIAANLFNALQAPAESLNSEIQLLTARLGQLPTLGHLMTGSGTACFGLCPNRRTAQRLAARLHSEGWGRVFTT